MASTAIEIEDELKGRLRGANFVSLTIRAFKLDLEDKCEDYGQVAYYKGTVPEFPCAFDLDNRHRFETGKAALICSNTAEMLSKTRYASHFRVDGDTSNHFGIFVGCQGDIRNESTYSCC